MKPDEIAMWMEYIKKMPEEEKKELAKPIEYDLQYPKTQQNKPKRKKLNKPKICLYCHKEFIPNVLQQKYCDKNCSFLFNKLRDKINTLYFEMDCVGSELVKLLKMGKDYKFLEINFDHPCLWCHAPIGYKRRYYRFCECFCSAFYYKMLKKIRNDLDPEIKDAEIEKLNQLGEDYVLPQREV